MAGKCSVIITRERQNTGSQCRYVSQGITDKVPVTSYKVHTILLKSSTKGKETTDACGRFGKVFINGQTDEIL